MQQGHAVRPRVAFVHAGARFHYAFPLALQRAGVLERVYLDWFVTPGSVRELVSKGIRKFKPVLGQRMLDRRRPELDPAKVSQRSRLGVLLKQRLGRPRDITELQYHFRNLSLEADVLLKNGFGDANAVMAFIRDTDPRIWEDARRRGLLTVGDQLIAPAAVEHDEAREQIRRWPDWQHDDWAKELLGMADYERRSWAALDHITCGSDYVKDGMLREGVENSRVSVFPYPLQAQDYPFIYRQRTGSEPVTVGFVGQVNLRKGAPYFIEVAKRLRARGIRFVMVGVVQLAPAVVEANKTVVEFVGAIPRSQVMDWLRTFDMILFPTTCEGSATALMEAMATGLPVITSPNSGTVARHGTDGFITPYDRVEEMAGYVERLSTDVNLRREMGLAARRRVETFTIDWFGKELGDLFHRLLSTRTPARP